ncbi:MAG: polymer-forming cytoskeletal protein [Gammaproteobacteria bacterium]|nr:polymer-forming cytoskeletal protein [Gammaproteobacteria bacterium]
MTATSRPLHALTLALALAAAPALAAEDISRVNGGIELAADSQNGDLSTVNGGIRIGDGARFKDASTVNGGIRAGHRVQGEDLATVNGGIELGEQAVVDSMTTVNGKISAGPGLRADDDVESVSGGIFIDRGGRVDGNVSTVNGGIGLVATEVTGNVHTVSGDVTVGIGSHVRGNLQVRKSSGMSWISFGTERTPRIVIGPDAVVDGSLDFEREVTLYVHESARTGAISGATPIPFSTPRAPRD